MRSLATAIRRAPVRVIASMLAVALGVAAMGVFAVPNVASGTLRDLASADRVAHVAVDVTAIDDETAAEVSALPGVAEVELRSSEAVETVEHGTLHMVGFDPSTQAINIVSASSGGLPGPGEAIVSEGAAAIGDQVTVGQTQLEIVGIGGTAWWSDTDTIYVTSTDASSIGGSDAVRLLVRHHDPNPDELDVTVESIRSIVEADGGTVLAFPEVLPDGRHPIEEDLVQISTMIGLLGVVAGIVAMVLLASTMSTLIAERSREVATMRALGARRRPLKRRLRRLALGVAALGLAVGLPLGVLVANVVARMVLERFVGVTPSIGYSAVVLLGSAAFVTAGAALVSIRSARRVTKLPLAEALRDRTGDTWGRRLSDRLACRLPAGGLYSRLGFRNNIRKRTRAISAVTQIAAGVAAVLVVASLATSVNAFNDAEIEPWEWETRAIVASPGQALAASDFESSGSGGVEGAITAVGDVGEWDVDVIGLAPGTEMIDTSVEEGRWLDGSRGVVVSEGFAEHQELTVGDELNLTLASGDQSYSVLGLHRSRGRDVYMPTDVLAEDLRMPGTVNTLFAKGTALPDTAVAMELTTVAQMSEEDAAARDAIVAIFGAIGAIVAGVAALGVASLMAVSLHERRHEIATMSAMGGRRRHLRRVLMFELIPLAVIGVGLGVAAGWLGASLIIGAFESSSAVEIGMIFARGAVLPSAIGALLVVSLIAVISTRSATAKAPAAVLRAAA